MCAVPRSARSNKSIDNRMFKKFHIQGHRGARGWLPENTIESCIEAVRRGVDGLEIDVVVSKDGQIVVSHEPWMSPLFCSFPDGQWVGTDGRVSHHEAPHQEVILKNMDYEEIRKYNCGLRGNPIFSSQKPISAYKPTLYELVNAVQDYCQTENLTVPFFNIEVKSHPAWYRKLVPPPSLFIALLKQPLSKLSEKGIQYYISSFDPLFLKLFKKEMPQVLIAFLTENKLSLELNLKRLGFMPNFYSPYYRFLTSKTVNHAHRLGIKVVTWTVNDERDAALLKKMGVDGIITDYPKALGSEKCESSGLV